MAQYELERKIKALLTKGIETEAELVYLLVEIRKLADKTKYTDTHLRMFCNWVAHIELDKESGGATKILQEFDNALIRRIDHKLPAEPGEHYTFRGFRKQLKAFLHKFNLPYDFIDDKSRWIDFATLYSRVVSECPIRFKASKQSLKYVQSVELVPSPRLDIGIIDLSSPGLVWKVTLKTKRQKYYSFDLESIAIFAVEYKTP